MALLANPPPMQTPLPHFLLHAETYRSGRGTPRWKFVLQSVGADERLTAADAESSTRRSRLELLAVVRGLEALDHPSRVTLLTRSRYVSRGIRRQLSQWRDHQWCWERFGSVVPIRDQDLWQRVDRALQFHTVECCVWNADLVPPSSDARYSTTRSSAWRSQPGAYSQHTGWSISAAIAKLRRGVLTPFSAIWRPPFTRAA